MRATINHNPGAYWEGYFAWHDSPEKAARLYIAKARLLGIYTSADELFSFLQGAKWARIRSKPIRA